MGLKEIDRREIPDDAVHARMQGRTVEQSDGEAEGRLSCPAAHDLGKDGQHGAGRGEPMCLGLLPEGLPGFAAQAEFMAGKGNLPSTRPPPSTGSSGPSGMVSSLSSQY